MATRLRTRSAERLCAFGIVAASLLLASAAPAFALSTGTASADYQKLIDLMGDNRPNGAGVPIAQIEATQGPNGPYRPNYDYSEFSNINFTDLTSNPNTGSSSHATTEVGRFFYGDNPTWSLANGPNDVAIYSASDWINDMSPFSSAEPLSIRLNVDDGNGGTTNMLTKVQNFSWISSYAASNNSGFDNPDPNNVKLLRKFDYQINRDDFTAVVGLNNGSSEGLPYLLAYSYNAIAAGMSNGNHSPGLTADPGGSSAYGPGRTKPDIVADTGSTSSATALVSSAATVLRGMAMQNGVPDADHSEITKAILLAGATKEASRYSLDWSHTSSQPLDDHYGAGELNIFNSFLIQSGGEFGGSASAATPGAVGADGWDYGDLTAGGAVYYEFDVPQGITADELSVILTWNTPGSLTNFSGGSPPLANLDLELRDSAGQLLTGPGGVLSESNSDVDNVEHIYLTDLAAGKYTLKVSGDDAADFGLAWRTETHANLINADFNNNGVVDGGDFLILQRGMGAFVNAKHGDGDADGDGDVDHDDLLAYEAGFGGLASVTPAAFAAFLAVPEPNTALLAALGLAALAGLYRSRRLA